MWLVARCSVPRSTSARASLPESSCTGGWAALLCLSAAAVPCRVPSVLRLGWVVWPVLEDFSDSLLRSRSAWCTVLGMDDTATRISYIRYQWRAKGYDAAQSRTVAMPLGADEVRYADTHLSDVRREVGVFVQEWDQLNGRWLQVSWLAPWAA